MAFAIYLHRDTFQPEAPQILDKGVHDPNVLFTFVDFIPSVIKRPTTVIPQSEVEYHSFSTMIQVANEWLQKHGHHWQVVNCETVIILYKYNDTNNYYELKPNDCCFYIYGSEKNNVLKALRIWIRKRAGSDEKPIHQVLSFKTLVPEYKKTSLESRFENLDELIDRFNDEMQTKGLGGKIITIESLAYEASKDWKIDTETSLSTFSTKNVFILRIFYELGAVTREQIGIQDFSPNLITRATFFKRPTFETFDKVIERASAWLQKYPKFQFINAQSIDIKMKSATLINSRQMAFTEHGDYMRIFRITYVKIKPEVADKAVILSTRLFLPHKKSDTITDIKQRLSEWIYQYLEKYRICQKRIQSDSTVRSNLALFPSVLSAETVEVFTKDFRTENIGHIEKAANDDTFLANRFGNKNAYMFFSLRIFYDSSSLSNDSIITTDSAQNTPNCAKRTN